MAGSVFAVTIVAVVLILAVGLTPFLLIPVVLFAMAGIFLIPGWLAARHTAVAQPDPAPTGSTTTADASYDPASGD